MRWLARLIYFRILNWKLEENFDRAIKKCVIIVAPHTSAWDFLIGILVRRILNIHIDFIAKKELFKPPFGWYFKMAGGTPLDRTGKQKKVDAIAAIFSEKEIFRLAMSPEGTRKKTERWKTGFYYIAVNANVPIIMVSFDFGKKLVKISEPFYPENGLENDFPEILKFYDGVEGKVRENF